MTASEWILAVTIVAIILAPITALWVGGLLQRRSDAHKTKLTIFGTLMAQRHDPLSIESVKALNLIDAAFVDDPAVREAWTRYYTALSDHNLNDNQGGSIREEKKRELLLAMVRALGLSRKISSADLLRSYVPTFAVEATQLAMHQRRAALDDFTRRAGAAGNGAAGSTPTLTAAEPRCRPIIIVSQRRRSCQRDGGPMSRWSIRYILLAASTLALLSFHEADAQRAIPDDNLAYPVLITMTGGTGSGFFLTTANSTFLVTARHVLIGDDRKLRSPHAELLSYSKDPANPEANSIALDLVQLQQSGALKLHPTRDVAVVRIGSTHLNQPVQQDGDKAAPSLDTVSGVTLTKEKEPGIVSVGADNVRTFDHVLIGNDVIVFGYPTSLGLKTPAQSQLDLHRPLLRKGMVAGLNSEKKSIVLDCPVYWGNSGGPVIQVDQINLVERRFNVIGVVGEYVPSVDQGQSFIMANNSGYSIASPMDFVLELVR